MPSAESDITLMSLPSLGITAIDRSFGCRATDKTLPDQAQSIGAGLEPAPTKAYSKSNVLPG